MTCGPPYLDLQNNIVTWICIGNDSYIVKQITKPSKMNRAVIDLIFWRLHRYGGWLQDTCTMLQTMPEPGGMPGPGLVVCFYGGIGGKGHIGVNRSSSVAEEGLMICGRSCRYLGKFVVEVSISRYTQGRNKERLGCVVVRRRWEVRAFKLTATSGTALTTISLSAVSSGTPSRSGGIIGSRSVVGGGSHVSGSTIGSKISGGISGGTFSGDLIVAAVQIFGLGAVKVKPPVADEVVLVEDGSVGAQEAVLAKTAQTVGSANVEHLALGLGVGVVTAINLTFAGEAGLGGLSVDGVVLAGDAGNAGLEHVEGRVAGTAGISV